MNREEEYDAGFVDWLEDEIWRQRLSQAELARRGNMSPARISQVLAAGERPGWQFVAGVARALNKDLSVVAHRAGLWELRPYEVKMVGLDPETKELLQSYEQLTPEQRELILLTVKTWSDTDDQQSD